MSALKSIQSTQLLKFAARDSMTGVKLAVRLGADVNTRNKDGWTAIMIAYSHFQPEMVKYLRGKGATMTKQDRMTAQFSATLGKEVKNEVRKLEEAA